jgi:type IV pilus assembly protein PilV
MPRHLIPAAAVRSRGDAGFSLVEVLVSLLVLSLGLLGLARLQAVALRQNHSAHLRSQATMMAYDMADRMRANRQALRAGRYHLPSAAATPACLTTAGCSPDAMAAHDMLEWSGALARVLPLGQGTVCIDSSPADGASAASPECSGTGDVYAIKVWWDDTRSGVASQQFVVSLAPDG